MNTFLLIIALIMGVIIFYIIISFSIVKANEVGVISLWGKPVRVVKSGLHFCPKFISELVRYETTPLIFNIKVPSVTTRNGKVSGYKENGGEIERVDLNIDVTLTTYFSSLHNDLLETARVASGNDAASLASAICPFVIDVVRSVFSEIPWPLANQSRRDVLDYLLSRIIPDYEYSELVISNVKAFSVYSFNKGSKLKGDNEAQMKRNNPFVQFKLDTCRTSLSITNIDFCNPDLVANLDAAENARLLSEAQRIKDDRKIETDKRTGLAEAEVVRKKGLNQIEIDLKAGLNQVVVDKKKGEVNNELLDKKNQIEAAGIKEKGLASAEARKAMIAEIKGNPDLEYLRTLEEMAKGTSNTILYQIPGAFESKISNILGSNKMADLLPLLKDTEVMKALKEALEKVK
jgi:regulator of protease activity HflC (stomatin/prohibitin superfamily)